MPAMDATERYMNSITNLPLPAPERQLLWARVIDRAQRGFNHAVCACPAAVRQLLAQHGDAPERGGGPRLLARCAMPQALSGTGSLSLLDTCLHALAEGLAHNDIAAMHAALRPLRLRSECMAGLCAALRGQAVENADVGRCLARVTRRLARIRVATNQLVQANQRLVVMLAYRYRNGPLAFLDLVQEGNLGLLRAIERFDPGHGARVSTYALWWVRRAMVYAIARQGRDVRPPLAQYWAARHVSRSIDRLEREQGRRMAFHESARHLGMSVAAMHACLATLAPPVHLDAPIAGAEDINRIERLTASDAYDMAGPPGSPSSIGAPDPEHALIDSDLRRSVQALLDHLPERHAKILRMRFGIGVHEDCTLEQIARQQGVTRERIRQIEAQALAALRKLDAAWTLRGIL
ncbi:MAG: sigma-70 family RNA polymerase sigma factor [Gammaproteobacteria bacterium]|nr:sigma-70 family RNA polymerase sigma factor [Gammaproteobacteria bacterium]